MSEKIHFIKDFFEKISMRNKNKIYAKVQAFKALNSLSSVKNFKPRQ